jgi:hypothetical protein
MKTYKQFMSDYYFIVEGKYSDEHAHRKVWNHFMVHKKHGKEVRGHLDSGDHDKALEHMKSEVEKAKKDPKHPLSFEKSKRGFTGTKESGDKSSYHKELDNAVHGVHALATKDRRTSNAAKQRKPMRVTGAGKSDLTKEWKKSGAKNQTPKRDLEIHDPKNKKYGIGISQKKSGGSQLMSAGPEETHATIKHAAKKLAKSMIKSGKSKEEASAVKSDIEKRSSRASRAIKAMERGSRERKDALKKVAQRHIDKMHDAHPHLAKHIGSEASSGEGKYGKKVSAGSGRAEILLKNADVGKKKSAEVHDIKHRERSGVGGKLRAAMPKSDKVNPKTGKTRSGNVKLDER